MKCSWNTKKKIDEDVQPKKTTTRKKKCDTSKIGVNSINIEEKKKVKAD